MLTTLTLWNSATRRTTADPSAMIGTSPAVLTELIIIFAVLLRSHFLRSVGSGNGNLKAIISRWICGHFSSSVEHCQMHNDTRFVDLTFDRRDNGEPGSTNVKAYIPLESLRYFVRKITLQTIGMPVRQDARRTQKYVRSEGDRRSFGKPPGWEWSKDNHIVVRDLKVQRRFIHNRIGSRLVWRAVYKEDNRYSIIISSTQQQLAIETLLAIVRRIYPRFENLVLVKWPFAWVPFSIIIFNRVQNK